VKLPVACPPKLPVSLILRRIISTGGFDCLMVDWQLFKKKIMKKYFPSKFQFLSAAGGLLQDLNLYQP
jgi:hypothetical protein